MSSDAHPFSCRCSGCETESETESDGEPDTYMGEAEAGAEAGAEASVLGKRSAGNGCATQKRAKKEVDITTIFGAKKLRRWARKTAPNFKPGDHEISEPDYVNGSQNFIHWWLYEPSEMLERFFIFPADVKEHLQLDACKKIIQIELDNLGKGGWGVNSVKNWFHLKFMQKTLPGLLNEDWGEKVRQEWLKNITETDE